LLHSWPSRTNSIIGISLLINADLMDASHVVVVTTKEGVRENNKDHWATPEGVT